MDVFIEWSCEHDLGRWWKCDRNGRRIKEAGIGWIEASLGWILDDAYHKGIMQGHFGFYCFIVIFDVVQQFDKVLYCYFVLFFQTPFNILIDIDSSKIALPLLSCFRLYCILASDLSGSSSMTTSTYTVFVISSFN